MAARKTTTGYKPTVEVTNGTKTIKVSEFEAEQLKAAGWEVPGESADKGADTTED